MGWCKRNVISVLLVVGCVFIVFGAALALIWNTIYQGILYSEFALTESSKSYEFWKETPIPMYFKIHIFNWTNAPEVVNSNWTVKPNLQELGPYVFYEHHVRVNVTWNENDSITFKQRKTWRFEPSLSNGTLRDIITSVNPVCVVIGQKVEGMPSIAKKVVNKILEYAEKKLYMSKTVDELLFTGYHDKIIDLLSDFHITMPYDKFGWFYNKNNSDTFDGNFTMNTGKTNLNLLGELSLWNGLPKTKVYTNSCSEVRGSTGELWPPVENRKNITIFSSDICGTLPFIHNGSEITCGITGKKFTGTDFAFDNGTKYPEQACFQGKTVIPSGLRDISKCQYGAPVFLSYPHFYLADSTYEAMVNGMKSNKTKHESYLELEGTTGIPLNVNVQLQLNMYLKSIENMSMFANVKPTYLPILWFSQNALLTQQYCSSTKLLVTMSVFGLYLGWFLFGLGIIQSIIAITLLLHKRDKELDEPLIENEVTS